ncbi:CapA family protein [Treponema sp. Marseille-Q4132]|uniref:CapA family protein n=1 Tax=Treponema sp. Marseille-Q4132 TaxID=2766701 RepID=UPI001652F5CF|nr:CapA family protein [Treponema sp. Marseille-Q4132]QNL96978.1 CapA family protein [Treponema sp. Marseille-Q4132]
MKIRNSLYLLFCIIVLASCKTVPKQKPVSEAPETPNGQNLSVSAEEDSAPAFGSEKTDREEIRHNLTLLFTGDIMAHKPNYSMSDYSLIWKDIAPLALSCDFSFANIEAPVDDSIPYATYPRFNMHSEYPEAAIRAGFNVFSLVNNHSNDQGLSGMKHTREWAEKTESAHKGTEREVFFSGLKKSGGDAIGYKIIKKNGWTIIFCAVTEVLNEKDHIEYMDYVPPAPAAREAFGNRIRHIRAENPCDIFILSIHANVPEYIRSISQAQRSYYYKLLDCGADIIWANHPHVVQEREFIGKKSERRFSKLILYANGNTISAQRHKPAFNVPDDPHEYTGDGLLYKVIYYKKEKGGIAILHETKAHYITTYITTAYQFVIKYLDDDFIVYLGNAGRREWMRYIAARKIIMENTRVRKTWL